MVLGMSISTLVGIRPIKFGDQGEAVRQVQLALAKLGYKFKGTGYFGGATDTAVSDFQRLHGLTPDGDVGPLTAAAIDKAVAGTPTAPAAEEIARPLWLIEAMKWLGLKERSGSADNPAILEWAKDEGGGIAQNYKHDAIPWCALFANMILTKTGHRGTETLWALDFANSKQFIDLPGPVVGAFAPMKRQGGGHIAVVVGRTRDGYLAMIGGNQSDAVTIAGFPLSRPNSFRWPVNGGPPPAQTGFSTLPIVNSAGVSVSEA